MGQLRPFLQDQLPWAPLPGTPQRPQVPGRPPDALRPRPESCGSIHARAPVPEKPRGSCAVSGCDHATATNPGQGKQWEGELCPPPWPPAPTAATPPFGLLAAGPDSGDTTLAQHTPCWDPSSPGTTPGCLGPDSPACASTLTHLLHPKGRILSSCRVQPRPSPGPADPAATARWLPCEVLLPAPCPPPPLRPHAHSSFF